MAIDIAAHPSKADGMTGIVHTCQSREELKKWDRTGWRKNRKSRFILASALLLDYGTLLIKKEDFRKMCVRIIK